MTKKIEIIATELSYDEVFYLYEEDCAHALELATREGIHSTAHPRLQSPIISELGDKISDLIKEIEYQDLDTVEDLEEVMTLYNLDLDYMDMLAQLVPVIQHTRYDEDIVHCALAQMYTGKPWSTYTAIGYSQGEWMRLVYPEDALDHVEDLDRCLYNKYKYYQVIRDYDEELVRVDDLEELEELIRAEHQGQDIHITIRMIDGYQTSPTYKEVTL